MPEWRYFTIPGAKSENWNPDIHGKEIFPAGDEDNVNDELTEVAWKPGVYEFTFGSCMQNFQIRVPEAENQVQPTNSVLKGFHEFLKVAFDE